MHLNFWLPKQVFRPGPSQHYRDTTALSLLSETPDGKRSFSPRKYSPVIDIGEGITSTAGFLTIIEDCGNLLTNQHCFIIRCPPMMESFAIFSNEALVLPFVYGPKHGKQ